MGDEHDTSIFPLTTVASSFPYSILYSYSLGEKAGKNIVMHFGNLE
jgi:hypothetical protein